MHVQLPSLASLWDECVDKEGGLEGGTLTLNSISSSVPFTPNVHT